MRLLILCLSSLATACAPVYAPSAFHLPLSQQAKDLHLGFHGGSEGIQGNAAYALTDNLVGRATLHYLSSADVAYNGYFRLYDAGIGYYWAGKPDAPTEGEFLDGTRASLNLDFGAGRARGTTRLNAGTISLSGSFLRTALQVDFGYEWQYLAIAVVGRGVWLNLTHDAQSDLAGVKAQNLVLEPGLVARFGTRPIKLELQLGASVGFNLTGQFGGWFPVIASAGIVADL